VVSWFGWYLVCWYVRTVVMLNNYRGGMEEFSHQDMTEDPCVVPHCLPLNQLAWCGEVVSKNSAL
jgi:hypothetical protein